MKISLFLNKYTEYSFKRSCHHAPIYKGHPDKPMVVFIINVAWGNEYLSDMLSYFKKTSCVRLLFFLKEDGQKIILN